MLLEARQRMPAVVAPGHHLEQHAAERGLGGAQALAQHRGQRARAIDELPDQVGPSAGLRVRGKLRELLLGLPVGRLGGGLDHRPIEVVEANLPGEVGDDRIAAFGGCHEAIEQLAEVLAHLSRTEHRPARAGDPGGRRWRLVPARRAAPPGTAGSRPPPAPAFDPDRRRRSGTTARSSRRANPSGSPSPSTSSERRYAFRYSRGLSAGSRSGIGLVVSRPAQGLDVRVHGEQLGAPRAPVSRS